MPDRASLSRRQFVKAAAAGAAALAAPTIITSRALGDDKKAPASERLTVGFIGIGKQASGHLNKLSGMANVQVLAVCDVHTGRRERAKGVVDKKYADLERAGYKGCDQYVDFRELLARKDIDAVVIGTPDHWHTIPIIEACKAGKDIYCEKPLTLTIHEAKTAIDVVRKYNRVFQTGSQQRSTGPFRQACELIRNGRIGKVKEVHIGVGVTSKPCDLPTEPTPEGIQWDMWLGQAPERGYNDILCRKESEPGKYPFNPGWRDYREFSGGFITDWGAHHFDITQWALDMDQSGPVEILPSPESQTDGYGAKWIYRGSPVGDEITVTHVKDVYEHEEHADATEPVNKRAGTPANGATKKDAKKAEGKSGKKTENNGILFIGDKGRLFVNRSLILSDPDTIVKQEITDSDKRLFKSPGHFENWIDCIKTRQRPIADVEVGARSATVCHLVNQAYWHKQKLAWDPQKWEFTGANATEANAWRDRERRAKYQLPTV